MPPRKKTAFEKWFSVTRHLRKKGVANFGSVNTNDFNTMKNNIISGTLNYTYGSENELTTHINNLKYEFVGLSELAYHHAKLIVLIRRDCDVKNNFLHFCTLWESEAQYLLAHLNTRWLIAACDTFIDHTSEPLIKAKLLNAVILINTLKIGETERFFTQDTSVKPTAIVTLQNQRVALFDGTSAFAVGTDDTLRNMRWRIENTFKDNSLYDKIVKTIFDRVNDTSLDTVYSRFRSLHTRTKTRWW